jgi:TolA-binding protein
MQTSINRDQKELDIQERKLNDSNVGQLETQLREVKAKLIKERITSKTRKLDDMHKTLKELNTRLEKIVAKQAKEEKARAEKEAAAKKAAAEAAEKAAQEASVEKAAPVVEEVIPVSKPTVLGADEEEELGEIIAEVKTKEEEE